MSDDKPLLFQPRAGAYGMTELHFAAYAGDYDALVRCLSAGQAPNQRDQYRGYMPLHWLADMAAVDGPRVTMLQLLIAHGADLDAQTSDGDTALMLACRSGSYGGNDLVAALIKQGANPRIRSSTSTALHEGIGDFELVKGLIAAGAPLEERDARGQTSLDAARARLADYIDEGGRGMEQIVAFLEDAARRRSGG